MSTNFISLEEQKKNFENEGFDEKYKEYFSKMDKEYEQYYNFNTRKKLNNLNDIISSSKKLFENFDETKLSIENLMLQISYGTIINKALEGNKILIFRFTIDNSFSFPQLISIIQAMNYSKELILTIKDDANINESQFSFLINEAKKKSNIVSITNYFNENYFGIATIPKKFNLCVKKKNNEMFEKFLNIFYSDFKDNIENIFFNFEDFDKSLNLLDWKIKSEKTELSLSFEKEKINEYEECLKFLSNKIETNNLKLLLFKIPEFKFVNEFLGKIHPSYLWLIPYQDVDSKYSDELLLNIGKNSHMINLNTINISGFSKNKLREFLNNQKDLIDLRITGNLSEDNMEEVLKCYIENEKNNYAIKKISLNGPINMNEHWKDLICEFLKLKNIEAFHIDCFFNGREYMKDIAEAFYLNNTLKSFAVRNSVRGLRDEFVDVLKEVLYTKPIQRKEVFNKIRLYKLL